MEMKKCARKSLFLFKIAPSYFKVPLAATNNNTKI